MSGKSSKHLRGIRRTGPAVLAGSALVLVTAVACGGPEPGRSTAAVVSSKSPVSAADLRWIAQAHQADLAEMDAGQLAADKGGSAAIRAAGAMLLADHTALDQRLTKVANTLGIALPTHQTLQQTQTGDRLTGESGPQFDHDFTASMLTGHQYMIAATRSEISHGSSAAILVLARQALPVLIKHLQTLQRAAGGG